jgi:hypothetical protein
MVFELPYLAIVGSRCDQRVVERTPTQQLALLLPAMITYVCAPVGIEDGSGVPAEERDLVGRAAFLVDRNDSECATAAGFPVDCDVFGVGLSCMSGWIRGRVRGELTLIRLVSHAFFEMRRLS